MVVCGAGTTTTTVPGSSTTTTTPPELVNGCDPATATDLTGQAAVTIEFGGAHGLAYAPPCVCVSAGTRVTFSGQFATHPLLGGWVTDSNTKAPDPGSPFSPRTNSGTTKTFTLTEVAVCPFYCDVHALADMKGVAFVGP